MRQALDKISTKILKIVPLLLSVLVPLFFLPLTTDSFAFNKYFLVALLASISLIAWCIRNLTRGKLHFTSSPALLPLVILVIANIVSSIWLSPTKHTSLFGQTSLFFSLGIIYLTVTSSQKNSFTTKSIVYGLIGSTTILSLFSLLHYFGLTTKIISSDTLNNKYFNPTGSILPALSLTIPVLIATTAFTTKLDNWIQKSILFASVLLMIIASVINISLILPQDGVPVISILPVRAGWSIAVDTMKTWQTAILGTGPETFFSAFTRLRPVYLNLNKNIWNIRFSESSNFIFTLITTTGLIGALSFILVFLRPLIVAIRTKKSTEDKATFYFVLAALITTTITFFLIPTGIVSLTLGFVLLIALTIELKLNNQKSVKDVTLSLSADTPATPAYRDLPETAGTTITSSFLPWLVLSISVAILSAYWFYAGQMYFASMSYKQAIDLSESDPYNAFTKFQKSAQLDRYNPYYPLKLSQIYLAVSDSYLSKENPTDEDKTMGTDFAQRALDAGKLSAQLDPLNVSTWENLASTYTTLIPYAQGSADMAVSHSLQAASLDPTNPTIYLQLGTLFYNLGDVDQAVKLIDRASELKQDWDIPYYNLSSIYKAKKDYTKALQYARAGLQYTDPESTELTTIKEGIKALEELVPEQASQQTAEPTSQISQPTNQDSTSSAITQ